MNSIGSGAASAPSTNAIGGPVLLAWSVAMVATLGALFVGEVMGQAPCNLCWYQRTAMFPLVVILSIAAYRDDADGWVYALPLAVLGAAIAGFHSLLYAGLIPETIEPCGAGSSCASAEMTVFGALPLPFLSFAAFGAIVVLLALSRKALRP